MKTSDAKGSDTPRTGGNVLPFRPAAVTPLPATRTKKREPAVLKEKKALIKSLFAQYQAEYDQEMRDAAARVPENLRPLDRALIKLSDSLFRIKRAAAKAHDNVRAVRKAVGLYDR